MRLAHAVLFMLFLCAAALAQEPLATPPVPVSAVEDVFLARDDGTGKAGEVVESFTTADIPIFCIVTLTREEPVTVKMSLVAVRVAGVKPETKVVSTSYTTKERQTRVNFTGRPGDAWVAGTYRIDIFVEGVREKSVTFEMVRSGPPVGASTFAPSKPKRPRKKN